MFIHNNNNNLKKRKLNQKRKVYNKYLHLN